jgi:universal stress protein E
MTAKPTRILVAIGFPAAADQPGIDKAVALAGGSGARVELFHAAFDPEAGVGGGLNRGSRAAREAFEADVARVVELRRSQLVQLAKRHAPSAVQVDVRVEWARPSWDAIAREARRIGADLIVGQSARRGVSRLLLTFPDWQLIRSVDVPLLLVKSPRPWQRHSVVAAIDPRHTHDKPGVLDQEILRWARRLAATQRAPVWALHTYPPAVRYLPGSAMQPVPTLASPAEQRRHTRAVRERVLRATRAQHWPASRVSVQAGDVVDVLPEFAAEHDAAVVVLGAISRSLLQRWLIGSTAERVLDRLGCDVLIVHPNSTTRRKQSTQRAVRTRARAS